MNFQFVISTKVDLPEAEVEDTIIHEMIHYWILSNQMQDTGPHGDIFKAKMKEINMKYNRNLSIVHKTTNMVQPVAVCLYFLAPFLRRYVIQIHLYYFNGCHFFPLHCFL